MLSKEKFCSSGRAGRVWGRRCDLPLQRRGDAGACTLAEGCARAFIEIFDSAGSSACCPHAGRARELLLGVWKGVRTGRQRLRRAAGE